MFKLHVVAAAFLAAVGFAAQVPIDIRFSPKPKLDEAGVWKGIQDAISASSTSIDVAMYSMSDTSHQKGTNCCG